MHFVAKRRFTRFQHEIVCLQLPDPLRCQTLALFPHQGLRYFPLPFVTRNKHEIEGNRVKKRGREASSSARSAVLP